MFNAFSSDGESSESTELGVFHGSDIPDPVQVTSNTAYILFTSDYSVTRSGFEIQWEPTGSGNFKPSMHFSLAQKTRNMSNVS